LPVICVSILMFAISSSRRLKTTHTSSRLTRLMIGKPNVASSPSCSTTLSTSALIGDLSVMSAASASTPCTAAPAPRVTSAAAARSSLRKPLSVSSYWAREAVAASTADLYAVSASSLRCCETNPSL